MTYPHIKPTRIPRRTFLGALAICTLHCRPSFAQDIQPPEPPPPASVAPTIQQADMLVKEQKYVEAIALVENKLKSLGAKATSEEQRSLSVQAASIYFLLGQYHQNRYESTEAIAAYQKAYELIKNFRVGDAAVYLNNIGNIYYGLGHKDKALDFAKQALSLSRKSGDVAHEAGMLLNIGFLYSSLAEPEKAIEYYNLALPVFRRARDIDGEATTLNYIGSTYYALGQPDNALDYFNRALPLFRQIGDAAGEASALSNLGTVYSSRSQHEQALAYYNQALPLFRSVKDVQGEAAALRNIGHVYLSWGQMEMALSFFNKSLPLSKNAGDTIGEATTIGYLGALYDNLGQYEKALDYYNQALLLFRREGNIPGEAVTLVDIGAVYSSLGQPDKALAYYNQALPLLRKVGDIAGEAATLSNIGALHSSLRQYEKALAFYTLALPLRRSIGDIRGEAITLTNIGAVYADILQLEKALIHFNQALPLLRKAGDIAGEATTLGHLMSLWYDRADGKRKPALAIFIGKQAVNNFQKVRGNTSRVSELATYSQKSFVQRYAGTFEATASFLTSQRVAEALPILERARQREYLNFMVDPKEHEAIRAATALPVPLTLREIRWDTALNSKLDTWIKLSNEADALAKVKDPTPGQQNERKEKQRAADAALADYNATNQRMTDEFTNANEHPTTEDHIPNSQIPELTALRSQLRTLGPGYAALYTIVGTDAVGVLLVTQDTIVLRKSAVKFDQFAAEIVAFSILLQDPRANKDPRLLGKVLYDRIIGLVASDLSTAHIHTLLVSPSKPMAMIPLGALSPDGKTYLTEHLTLVQFTPGMTAKRLTDAPRIGGKTLAAGVAVSVDGQPPLPNVTVELTSLVGADGKSGIVPGDAPLIDGAFTLDALQMRLQTGDYAVVHLATHFTFAGNDIDSFLLTGKGKINLAQIKRLPDGFFKNVDLLTLSACQTGIPSEGRVASAEVENFAELAQRKGAAAVLASLWSVNDASTAVWMESFYRCRKEGSKSEALRKAQISLVRGVRPKDAPALPTAAMQRRDPIRGVVPQTIPAEALPTKVTELISLAPAYISDRNKPFAHPYYWAPFILIGNPR